MAAPNEALATAPSRRDRWLVALSEGCSPEATGVIEQALDVAERAHGGQKRASGDDYVTHPIAVAEILRGLRMDHEVIAAALLHDVVEDTPVDLDAVRAAFGPAIASLVDGVTRMEAMDDYGRRDGRGLLPDQQTDRLKKLLLAIVQDVRVVLIKLADRLHNMRTLSYLEAERAQRIARETLDVYAPLASRLGIWQFKWELEDLAFRTLEPERYAALEQRLEESRSERERYVAEVSAKLEAVLAENDLKGRISGRPKHIHGIAKKMRRKGVGFEQIFDALAVRVLVEDVTACYTVLGLVHAMWPPVPGEFDDYIARPKPNRYQSLHTAVVGPQGKTVEVQIRTDEMHRHAEFGIAAHWRYKEGVSGKSRDLEAKTAWLRQVLDWKEESDGPDDLMARLNADLLDERVYVITPKGEILDLPAGATPLDFAYYVHTDVGHRCRGAKVNGSIVPLTYRLRSGDQVEVLTTRHGTPSRDWLNPHLSYLGTPRARAKVRHWFKQLDYERNRSDGAAQFSRELTRLGVEDVDRTALAARFNYRSFEDLMAGLGAGDVTLGQLTGALQHAFRPRREAEPRAVRRPRPSKARAGDVKIHGVGNLLTAVARCCHPVPPDPIVGYVTRGRGVTVHRRDCGNVLRLEGEDRQRLLDVSWSPSPVAAYPVDVQIVVYDRQGLLRDITTVIAAEQINVASLNVLPKERDETLRIHVTLEVRDVGQLSRVLDRIGQVTNVIEVGALRG